MSVGSEVESRLFFAHEQIRDSQKKMVSDGIIALQEGGSLLAAAPTGIGKTAAALASAFEVTNFYNANPEVPKILFMTGRQSQHRIVVETVRLINSNLPSGNPRIRLVDIIGREGMCDSVNKSTGECTCEEGIVEPARKGRRADLEDFILEEPRHVDRVIKEGVARGICAWATARSAVRRADILVCDYNHVFVEEVRENSLPVMSVDLDNAILVVDEAHNLPDRIRLGLERIVTTEVFRRARIDVNAHKENLEESTKKLDLPASKSHSDALLLEKQVKALEDDSALSTWFSEKTAENEASKVGDLRIDTGEFLGVIARAIEGIEENGPEDGIARIKRMNSRLLSVVVDEDDSIEEDGQNDCIRLAEFLDICIKYRDSPALSLIFDNVLEVPRVISHLLDPSVVGGPIFKQCAGSILMSGTLFPPVMYSDILGIPEDKAMCKEYYSGFPPDNRPVFIARDVTSKFTEREGSYSSIRDHIRSVLEKTDGNVAVFAPSYAMLDRIYADIDYTFGKQRFREERGMSKRSVDGTVGRLHELKSMGFGAVLFGVLSGKFSEGVDYAENVLDAVVCIGLPLPPPSARQDALLEYYAGRFGRSKAWKYASLQPAVNSIMQALGRPIRKREDKAIIVLLEKRLLERRVRDCLPKSMHTRQTTSPSRTSKHVERFFEMS
ncbi:MAG: hypothetical protein CMA54_00820 [Euryarchaeota archaeon]|jgi:DNA excision repair protein ERCC-2|nr:hypothetical protein [Euryarchaeota archaeon]MDP7649107.1 ATP-dependent DNA helicase [Candidatus Thalassarchaeaceae archaeon]HJM76895.1 ATP-dependent DNA helicase [Candidatus Thalassarchaeaceae archaeon]HJO84447.1 ATP-dependent DNA helicase [Candidatus Thalassarchaeaceae archaeon]|tara:strand:- start:7538 stop:9544 length:2007 start_codon:yes stop_codon:yes gene_type:complete